MGNNGDEPVQIDMKIVADKPVNLTISVSSNVTVEILQDDDALDVADVDNSS